MRNPWIARVATLALSAAMTVGLMPTMTMATEEPVEPTVEAVSQPAEETSADAPKADEDTTKFDEDAPKADDELPVALAATLPADAGEGTDGQTPAPVSNTDVVYLDGVNGSDTNDGLTAATAVKTFAKAKQLLGTDGTEIRMVNTVTITGNETWTLGEGQVVIRDESFDCGPMIHVNSGVSDFTLNSITIDGGYGTTNEGVRGSDTYQQGGAIIDLNYGISQPSSEQTNVYIGPTAVLQNNHVVSGQDGQDWNINGGAIFARDSASYGTSTTYLYGTIQNCFALNEGGGACIMNGAKLRMLDGSAITNCSTTGVGGGVSVATIQNKQSSFRQDGGTISNCKAGGSGGGVFVSLSTYYLYGGSLDGNDAGGQGGAICLYDGAACVISGETSDPVNITNNASHATNPNDETGAPVMGGGGIYVDTTPTSGGYRVASLYLDPAVITDNYADVDGGGISLCPEGEIPLKVDRSVAIYGNSTNNGNAEDLMVVRTGTTTSDGYTWELGNREGVFAYVSPTMLGDGAYRWLDPDGNEYPLDKLQYVNDFFGTASVMTDSAEAQAAQALATVIIKGNTADSFGGGVACNGRLLFSPYANTTDDTVSLTINKTWADDTEALRPENLRFSVLRDGEKISYVDVTPDDDGNWSITVPDLIKSSPDGSHDYVYTIEEEAFTAAGEYEAGTPTTSTDDEGNVTAEITNTHIAPVAAKFSKRDVSGNELSGAKMQVLDADGNVIDEWVSDGTNHEVDLASGTYTLHEETAPEGYKGATDIEFTVDAKAGTVTLVDSQTIAEGNLIVMTDEAIPATTPDTPDSTTPKGPDTTVAHVTATPATGDVVSAAGIIALAGVALLATRRLRRDA